MLSKSGYEHPIVLGIPGSGMVVAAEVAKALAAELGVVVARRLEAPYQPELSIGAITADGTAYVDAVLAEEVGANQHYLLEEQRRQAELARQRQGALDGSRDVTFEGRDVLVIVDGLTTGASAVAAVRSTKAAGAKRVIVATPVGSPDAVEKLRQEAAEMVCLLEAPGFLSVAQFYDDFRSIDDDDIRNLLEPPAAPFLS